MTDPAHTATGASDTSTHGKGEASATRKFASFADFYPFYLTEHRNLTCRRLHFVGTTLSLGFLAMLLATGRLQYLLYGLVCGYAFAWVGHFFFEKNKPATFKYPFFSFAGDWVMYKDIWLGKVKI